MRKLGAGDSNASRIAGEKMSDCGSATWGEPAKTLWFQKGDCPEWIARARNSTCAWKCALASNGIVTDPESQGQQRITHAITKAAPASRYPAAFASKRLKWTPTVPRRGRLLHGACLQPDFGADIGVTQMNRI